MAARTMSVEQREQEAKTDGKEMKKSFWLDHPYYQLQDLVESFRAWKQNLLKFNKQNKVQ